MSEIIGVIAGQGRLPVAVAEGIRASGRRVCGIGLAGHYPPELVPLCDTFHTAGVLRLGRWVRKLQKSGATKAIVVGRVDKGRMHDPLRLFRQIPDLRAALIWYRHLRHDKRSSVVLGALADELERGGITLIDSTSYIPEHMATSGVMTKRTPTQAEAADLDFGWRILKDTVELEIGQAITVRERDVIGVEAVEGTDRLIERTGALCPRKGWTLLKTASNDHDMRSDVPTVGVNTIAKMAKHGATCLAVGAGRVILLDRPQVLEAAERAGITIVGVGGESDTGTDVG